MSPTVGQTIHYVARGSADGLYPAVCRAAIVTQLIDSLPKSAMRIGLCAINPTGLFFHESCEHHPGDPAEGAQGARCSGGDRVYAPGTWHFPELELERVDVPSSMNSEDSLLKSLHAAFENLEAENAEMHARLETLEHEKLEALKVNGQLFEKYSQAEARHHQMLELIKVALGGWVEATGRVEDTEYQQKASAQMRQIGVQAGLQ